MVRFALQRAEFRVAEAGDAQAARVQITEAHPDLILMDWMLPGVSGVELARELKAAPLTRDLPIIMVTARTEEDDRVRGLNIGCDDYLTKPFSFPELVARIKAVLRRTLPGGETEKLSVAGLEVDGASQRVTAKGELVRLGPTEYRLLH